MTDDLEREVEETRERIAEDVDLLVAKAADGGKKAGLIAIPIVLAAVIGFVVWKKRG